MLRASQSCIRAVSPILHRHATNPSRLACAQGMSSDASGSKVTTPSSKPASPSTSEAGVHAAKAAEPVEKGDTYKAGEEYFSFNTYSFYDIENDMLSDRCPQPSSEKMKEFCLDKLNPEEEYVPRKLLAEEYGELEEYPGKVIPPKPEKPSRPVMRANYNVGPTLMDKETHYRGRMPL